MSFRTSVLAVVLGLIACLGQAQEQTQPPSGQTGNQQSPPETLPTPVPVDIVEDQAAADASKRSEEEARQREIADLAAQQGMNAATQSIDAATQDMRDYALYSTLLVGLGTFMLGVTLLLTRQANVAVMKSVETTKSIGEKTVMAYLAVTECVVSDGNSPRILITVKNFGQSPADRVVCTASFGIEILSGYGEDDVDEIPTIRWMFSLNHRNLGGVNIEAGGEAVISLMLASSNTTSDVDTRRIKHINKAIFTGSNALSVNVVTEWMSVFNKGHAIFSQFNEEGRGSPHRPENGKFFTRPRALSYLASRSIEFGERPNVFLCTSVEPTD